MQHDEHSGIRGMVLVEVHDAAGALVARCETRNLVTQVGDQMYAERGAGLGSPPAAPTGMRLGTGSTAVAKTGAGAAVVTKLTDGNQAIDGGYPTSALSGSARRVTYRCTYAAGKATTASPITEVVLVNDTIGSDVATAAANTIARALISGVASKDAGATLTITWTHDLLGA